MDPAKPTKDYTYAYDVHGSVSALVDEAGSVAASYGYDAYGEKDAGLSGGDPEDTNPLNPYRYSARRFDSGSGTIDMGVRRFGPDVARFLQPDLFLGSLANLGLTTDVLTGNRYALAAGNPLSFLEWDGHMPINDGYGGSDPNPNPTPTVLRSTYTAIREGGSYARASSSSSAISRTTARENSFVEWAARLGVEAGHSVTSYVEGSGAYLNKTAYEIFARAGYGFSSNRAAQSWIARADIMRSESAAKLARSGALRAAGGALIVAGGILVAVQHHAEGESWTRAGAIGTSSALFSYGGAVAGAEAIGSLCVAFVASAPFAPACAGIGGVVGGVVGGWFGEQAAEAITSEANPLTYENQAKGWTSLIFPSFG